MKASTMTDKSTYSFSAVKTEQRLTLFYLLNDVVQHSKRKNYDDLLEKFEGILKEVMPYMKEDKICEKVQRCLDIWVERQVFSEKFVGELSPIIKKNKEEQELIDNFQVGPVQSLKPSNNLLKKASQLMQ